MAAPKSRPNTSQPRGPARPTVHRSGPGTSADAKRNASIERKTGDRAALADGRGGSSHGPTK